MKSDWLISEWGSSWDNFPLIIAELAPPTDQLRNVFILLQKYLF